jgi:hypothetical protein
MGGETKQKTAGKQALIKTSSAKATSAKSRQHSNKASRLQLDLRDRTRTPSFYLFCRYVPAEKGK